MMMQQTSLSRNPEGFTFEQLFKVFFKRINAGNFIFPASEKDIPLGKKEFTKIRGNFGPLNFKNVFFKESDVDPTTQLQQLQISNNNPALIWNKHEKSGYITNAVPINSPIPQTSEEFVYPLFLSNDNELLQIKKPNFNTAVIRQINISLGLTFIPQAGTGNVCYANNNEDMRDDFKQVYTSLDLLDYIYAVVFPSFYRQKEEKNSSDNLPIIPYPSEEQPFWQLVKLGSRLRQLHSLNFEPKREFTAGNLPDEYNNTENRPKGISKETWNFSITGIKPIQVFLLEKSSRKLSSQEMIDFERIVNSVTETIQVTHEIDEVISQSSQDF